MTADMVFDLEALDRCLDSHIQMFEIDLGNNLYDVDPQYQTGMVHGMLWIKALIENKGNMRLALKDAEKYRKELGSRSNDTE